jgi:ribosomal-protein-serine acetyltransferase
MRPRELGDGLVLRPFEETDADELFALVERSRAHLAPWMPWLDGHTTRADSLRFIRESREQLATGEGADLAIAEHGRVVGVASLVAIDAERGSCRCGYWLAPDAQGRGIITRAVASLLEHAFAERGLGEVELRAAPGNARSRAVAERLGFRFERTLADSELFGEAWRDQVQYLLRVEEWRRPGRAG